MLRSPNLCVLLALLVVLAAFAPVRAQTGQDAFLDLVPLGADYAVSVDARSFRGTTLWETLIPIVIGDTGLFDHPDVESLRRLSAAGTLLPLPAWSLVAADGLFVRTQADPGLDFFGGLDASVDYYDPLPPSAPHLPVYRGAVVSRSPSGLVFRMRPPLAAYAADLVPAPPPSVWGVFRISGLRDLTWLPLVLDVPFPPFLTSEFLYVGFEPERDWRFTIAFDVADPAAAGDAVDGLVALLADSAREGLVHSWNVPRAAGSRVTGDFHVVPNFYETLFSALASP